MGLNAAHLAFLLGGTCMVLWGYWYRQWLYWHFVEIGTPIQRREIAQGEYWGAIPRDWWKRPEWARWT